MEEGGTFKIQLGGNWQNEMTSYKGEGRSEDVFLFPAYLLLASIKNKLDNVFKVLIVVPGRQQEGQLTN